MSFCFFPAPYPPDPAPLSIEAVDIPFSWHRPLAVALAAALAAALHGLVAVWYLNRPAPEPITEAVPLPMIDIALMAPPSAPPAEPIAPPVVLPPTPTQVFIPPKTTKPLPVKKPKPKVERKEPIAKPDPPAEQRNESTETATAEPPAAPPVAGSHADSRSGHSEAHYTPANSNANYLRNPAPVYPNVARQRHWEGLVLLRVFVTEHGHCGEIGVQRSSGHDVLDESAMIAVRKWMFIPAKRGETTVSSWVTVPIEFRLE